MGLLDGKVVIVTGAGRGVGRSIAMQAAREGAKVVVNDLGGNPDGSGDSTAGPADEVANEIKAAGGEAVGIGNSVADEKSAHGIVECAMDAFGRLDGVVNNAGILRDKMFHKMDAETFDSVLKVHLYGAFFVSNAAAPIFRKQESGAYVHMTSSSALFGNLGQANYMAAKLGIVGLSKSIAMDLGRYGVRSNCIAPWAWTRLVGTIPENTPEQKARVEGLKRLKPELIAPFPVALLSDAAKDVTGQVFGTRTNEIYLFSQPGLARSVHADEGWTPQTIVDRAIPALKSSFHDLKTSGEVFTWDPV